MWKTKSAASTLRTCQRSIPDTRIAFWLNKEPSSLASMTSLLDSEAQFLQRASELGIPDAGRSPSHQKARPSDS